MIVFLLLDNHRWKVDMNRDMPRVSQMGIFEREDWVELVLIDEAGTRHSFALLHGDIGEIVGSCALLVRSIPRQEDRERALGILREAVDRLDAG